MKTVLYAEDYPDDVFFMKRAFKQLASDIRLFIVNNGAEAIAYLSGKEDSSDRRAESVPSLVLLDLSMPITNGFDVLQWIRSKPELQDVPVFVLTSSNNDADRERATALGANGYMVKPGQPEGLVELLLSCKKYWL